jgi:hypothetical protein
VDVVLSVKKAHHHRACLMGRLFGDGQLFFVLKRRRQTHALIAIAD